MENREREEGLQVEGWTAKPQTTLGGQLSDLISPVEINPSFSPLELAFVEKLNTAFSYALLLGYNKSLTLLFEVAMAESRLCSQGEVERIPFTFTSFSRAILEREREELLELAPDANATAGIRQAYEALRESFNRRVVRLEEDTLKARKIFAENITEAQQLAQAIGKPRLVTLIEAAQESCPEPLARPDDELPKEVLKTKLIRRYRELQNGKI